MSASPAARSGPGAVLVVDADPAARRALVQALERAGRGAAGAGSVAEARRIATEREPGLVVLELILPDGDGLAPLDELRAGWPGLPPVDVTRHGEPRRRVEAMRRAAHAYVAPPRPGGPGARLPPCRPVARGAAGTGPGAPDEAVELVGPSGAMGRIRAEVARLAQGRLAALLVTGEDGVGKTTVARAVHGASRGR